MLQFMIFVRVNDGAILSVPREYFPDIPFKADTKVAKRLGDIT